MSDTIITDDDAWLDLRVGVTCLVKGRLDSVFSGSSLDRAPGVIVTFCDWTSLPMVCDNKLEARMTGQQVTVRARRTEDGMKALAIWTDGGAPIPL